MKALVLAAGFGTRLLPYTDRVPKPLFCINGRPLLDRMIGQLAAAGCSAVIVNTHHLHEQIESHIRASEYPIPVRTRFEPVILGSGGAIRNVEDFLDDQPFFVVNSDIVMDFDLRHLYEFHLQQGAAATLALVDDPRFNSVRVDPVGKILGFDGDGSHAESPSPETHRRWTFTGIQVVAPSFPAEIPKGKFSSSIDAYRRLIRSGIPIHAYFPNSGTWTDIGSVPRFQEAAHRESAAAAFAAAFSAPRTSPIEKHRLQGDGSDRTWYRLVSGKRSLIMADHGIRGEETVPEADAFVHIGRHLHGHGLPVPRIHHYEPFSGLVFLEDLGDSSLFETVRSDPAQESALAWYRKAIDRLIDLSIHGAAGFDPAWTCQTPRYDRDLVMERECRYFMEAFINGYLHMDAGFDSFLDEFSRIADAAADSSEAGFMHRDFQSKNIMVRGDELFFIDFQGGRIGPVEYDLASLLIDPYVALSEDLQRELFEYAMEKLGRISTVSSSARREKYLFCRLARNLQILGAFGFLSQVKGKTGFEAYIPAALRSLKTWLNGPLDGGFPDLQKLANSIPQTG